MKRFVRKPSVLGSSMGLFVAAVATLTNASVPAIYAMSFGLMPVALWIMLGPPKFRFRGRHHRGEGPGGAG